jgi:hypothetical protein
LASNELVDEQLQEVLQTGSHPRATDGQMHLREATGVVGSVASQQGRQRGALGVDVPMAPRDRVHVLAEVESEDGLPGDAQGIL